jgi:hypothetical protein
MADGRRGRKRQEEYRELVMKALTADRFTLEDFPILSQLPAIEHWAAAHPRELLPHGKAIQGYLRQAVKDVIASVGEPEDETMRRLVEYLQLRYLQKVSQKAIAERWGCSTVQVWRSVGHRAIDLITARFLELARVSPNASSAEASTTSLKVVDKAG